MRRRDRWDDGEPEREDRWVVSYADFITLLFAFFTTLYAISRVDLGKLERFTGSMKTAFSGAGERKAAAPVIEGIKPVSPDALVLEKSMRTRLEKSGIIHGVTVSRNERGVAVSFEDSLFFEPGSADLTGDARLLLAEVAAVIRETRVPIIIEGHTDTIPIRNSRYSSNWELSAARATSTLMHLVQSDGAGPERLSAAGYGEYRPVASNATAAGRAKNRRVDIIFVEPGEGSSDASP
jgi:chemotaxis protein MotB